MTGLLDRLLARHAAAPGMRHGIFRRDGDWHAVTLDAFLRQALRATACLRAVGVRPGDLVLIILPDQLQAQAAFVGAMLAGGVPSFLPYPNSRQDVTLYWEQHRQLLALTAAPFLIAHDALCEAVEAAAHPDTVVLAQSRIDGHAPGSPGRCRRPMRWRCCSTAPAPPG